MSTERPDHDVTDPAEGAGTAGPRRRHSPVAIASVAAAVLLVGGGGAYFAATASGDGGGRSGSGAPGGDGTPPPLALDGYSEGPVNGIAPGEANRQRSSGTARSPATSHRCPPRRGCGT